MSVWQEWLISLAYVFPENASQENVSTLVYQLFSILLFHAIRIEYGGWRVWVDTLAITHSKVSFNAYQKQCRQLTLKTSNTLHPESGAEESESTTQDTTENDIPAKEAPTALYRLPQFSWADVHVRLLDDLLKSIEGVVETWTNTTTSMIDHVNNTDNQVFISNTIHVLSQLIDSLIMACGGLLPLLAAATAPNVRIIAFL